MKDLSAIQFTVSLLSYLLQNNTTMLLSLNRQRNLPYVMST